MRKIFRIFAIIKIKYTKKMKAAKKKVVDGATILIRMPRALKSAITQRVAQATIDRGKKVAENAWVLEALEKAVQ